MTNQRNQVSPIVLHKSLTLPKSQKKVIIISLNRPQQLNAFNADVCTLLSQILSSIVHEIDRVDYDDSIAAVILTGEGPSFCAGADLANPPDPLKQSSDYHLMDNPVHWMGRVRVPLIGVVKGYCVTGGFELALACDILIGDKTTVFKDTHVTFGFAPCWGLSQRLQRRVGSGRAKLMSFTAMSVKADKALEWGLLDEMVKIGGAFERAMDLADEMGVQDGLMVRRYKRAVEEGGRVGLGQGLERERELGMAHYLEIVEDGRRFAKAKDFIHGDANAKERGPRSKL